MKLRRPGGGQYWGKVEVATTSAGKSYGWLTGDDPNAAMNSFRGFESEHNGTISTEYPTIKIKVRYHNKQSKDFEYKSPKQDFRVITRDGTVNKRS